MHKYFGEANIGFAFILNSTRTKRESKATTFCKAKLPLSAGRFSKFLPRTE